MDSLKVTGKIEKIMEDIRQTEGWAGYLRDKEWKVVSVPSEDKKHKMNAFIIPLGLFGMTMMKLQRSRYDPNWTKLKKIKRNFKVVSSIIEPIRVQDKLGFKMAGYKLSRFPYLATNTFIVDLTKSELVLWNNLSENARRQVKKNKDILIEECVQKRFFELWKKNSKVWTMKEKELCSLIKRFKGQARLVVSRTGNIYHSGLLIIYSADCANYYQTWTSNQGRISGAHYKLVWEEILRAKSSGIKFFDLEGIFDERWPQKRWLGFTEFKRRFGGGLVSFPGSYFRWL
ncbi:hypothetical protein COT86_01970 [Candidatus Collierbacteria bacterium CG10_big_fil_rev_8_21_14_0_10_43_36]|uniref:BioF2-like acetyltransferase domain-containing protein n=3 Tax=Candidatus Collieribacteriota TaxID=1752725 RepID=A0A2H0DVP2_9BACT|nr:MAG: hypothetical protein COW83_00035 [Candidatus Collierbacteria bacterium CG22_combo_CG10-13_8_21_14_all_43_12]PIR99804.1 MAG: hypothetical protein COT86_01970 [Candidatus Collierbacteria bacterium CG10_big_fil_rev_8_21_14_0_10_43_36]PIZ24749.1 MAG: hypothetical protein COY48_01295 [Candidatus Collierbacteria bacterium CG_4_10_14_0_8_um_filter_43_86]PJB47121.1 MAG: hypothetical protein CO104_04470 [Candidatus Collierbacteria bacterium CG_4_9_14_3_um_filter_43_16]